MKNALSILGTLALIFILFFIFGGVNIEPIPGTIKKLQYDVAVHALSMENVNQVCYAKKGSEVFFVRSHPDDYIYNFGFMKLTSTDTYIVNYEGNALENIIEGNCSNELVELSRSDFDASVSVK